MSDITQSKAERMRFRIVRWAVLIAVLVISTVIGLLHQKMPDLRLVAVDALCPFGGIESLWKLLASGAFLKRIAWGSVILLVGAVATNFVFGRAFCGQFCPLGTLQDLFSALRDELRIHRLEVPAAVDVPARFLKYAVLGVFTWLTWRTGELVIRAYDPWVAFHHLTSAEVLTEFGIGLGILAVSLVGALIYDRFFCKYLCPMGAFLGLFNKLGIYQVTRHADACIDCRLCDKACPVNIKVASVEHAVRDSECISCGLCIAACPKPEALAIESRNADKRVTPMALLGATLAIMLGLVAVATATGTMEFRKGSLASDVKAQSEGGAFGGGAEASGAAGAATGATQGGAPATGPLQPGQFDVSLIKGYMTMAEVSQATGIPGVEFEAQFGVSGEDLTVPLKEMKNRYDFDTQAVRDFVAARLGVPTSEPESCQ